MSIDIRNVKDMTGLITYFAEKLQWNIDPDDFDDIEDVAYDFEAEDIGLKEEAFAKINSLLQLPPLVDGQKWGIFCVEFDSRKFEVTALRKILSGLIPKRRNSADHAVWEQKDLLFLCFWGQDNDRTIGVAHFEEKESGLPTIKMISCAPAVEDFTQIRVFEDRLKSLQWPMNYVDHEKWREDWSGAFTTGYRQTIQDASTLTTQLAIEAQGIRNRILEILKVETVNGYVHLLYEKFKDTLIHDMTEIQFADMYAQTVVYGLFSARCMDDTQDDFSAAEAVSCIPNTNPFLKSLMEECLGAQNNSKLSFDELEIGNVVDLLLHTRTDAIIKDFNRQTGGGKEDPVIHFYEEFLTAYDKQQKVQRGVFYTPQPVVNFIVGAVDNIIKTEFGLVDGLASTVTKKIKVLRQSKKKINGFYRNVETEIEVPAIQILDPATGTGTFIRQTILKIYDNFKQKNKSLSKEQLHNTWNEYVPTHLLPRINAFELMMAPYAVAHMKLAMVLRDTGYDFRSGERLNVFLTNTLEEPGNSDHQMTLWSDPLALESIAANSVKKNNGINVCIGNPPYAGSSSNKGEWIMNLMEAYKKEPGGVVKLQERNPKWLNDDYVKFIRYAQALLEKSDMGILAYICPHGFIDNPTFRGMRWNLLKTFDKIFIVDLHGNMNKHEICPDGSKDENVFDILQGVSINIFVKKGKKDSRSLCKVYHTDLYGTRQFKYNWLNETKPDTIKWEEVSYTDPYYFFLNRNIEKIDQWKNGESITDIFPLNSVGIVTARDKIVIDVNKEDLLRKIRLFCDSSKTDDEIRQFFFGTKQGRHLPGDTDAWNLSIARERIRNYPHEEFVQEIAYRLFDNRFIYYCSDMIERGRESVMNTMIIQKNISVIVTRQSVSDKWTNVFVSNKIVDDSFVSNKTRERGYCFPLYLDNGFPNVSDMFIKKMHSAIGLKLRPQSDEQSAYSPLDLMGYVYAVLYSNNYRDAFSDQLKSEFPRIPYPTSKEVFWKLSKAGSELISYHTLQNQFNDLPYEFVGNDTATIEKPFYKDNRIYINKNCYFTAVPEYLWNFTIGAYQPLQKWLKDRKKTTLSIEDITHYKKIIAALKRTEELMAEIDFIFEF